MISRRQVNPLVIQGSNLVDSLIVMGGARAIVVAGLSGCSTCQSGIRFWLLGAYNAPLPLENLLNNLKMSADIDAKLTVPYTASF